MPFYGGMPFESGVEVDDNWPQRKTFGRPAKPQINLRIATISRFKEQVTKLKWVSLFSILLRFYHIATLLLCRS